MDRGPTVDSPWSAHYPAWAVTILFFVVGDAVTTGVGVGLDGIVEIGPVAAPLLQQYGVGGLLLLKLVVLGGFALLWRLSPHPYNLGIPLGLTVVGVSVTGWNTYILLLVLVL